MHTYSIFYNLSGPSKKIDIFLKIKNFMAILK